MSTILRISLALSVLSVSLLSRAQTVPLGPPPSQPASEIDATDPFGVATAVVQALVSDDLQSACAHHRDPETCTALSVSPERFAELVSPLARAALDAASTPLGEIRWVEDSDERAMALLGMDAEGFANVLSLEWRDDRWTWDECRSMPGAAFLELAAVEQNRQGILGVTSRPRGFLIVDGHNTEQMTPVRQAEIAVGRHEIQVLYEAEGLLSEIQAVFIRPGDRTDVSFRLSTDE